MSSLDDTQPRSPFANQPIPQPDIDPNYDGGGGPGCMIWGIVGVFSVILSVAIVLLAGLAGINAGLPIAQAQATSTQAGAIQQQCDHIAQDVNTGNGTGLVQARLDFLLEQTPAPGCLNAYIPTATAYFLSKQPTPTFQPTETPTLAAEVTAEPELTAEPQSVAPTSSSGYDLASLMSEARGDVAAAQWTSAIDTLDAIAAIDPTYQKSEVERMLFQALTSQAENFYRSGRLAEAIILTDRARQFGDVDTLNYEQFIAELYLDAQRNVGLNTNEAIRLLRRIVVEQGLINYQGGAAAQLLYDQYLVVAEAYELGGQPCEAVGQYGIAIQFAANTSTAQARGNVVTKRDAAQAACTQLTAVPGGLTITPDGDGAAPTEEPTIQPVGQS